LADLPGIDISKISNSKGVKKKVFGGFFGNSLSDAKAANKICKVWSLGRSSWVWARVE
jgi:hypothetical protein